MEKVSIFLALLHHPVLNQKGDLSTTAVTNVDVHDISRLSRTYGVARFFVVTPIELQQELCNRVIRHWRSGPGSKRNASRAKAFEVCEVISDLKGAIERVTELTGQTPLIAATGAQLNDGTVSYKDARERFINGDKPILMVLGTGWGLVSEVIDAADIKLTGIVGKEGYEGYNHLSVRAAAAIMVDRLLGNYE